jgi:two-component system cell cycle sensor histidine kinase/response regulator CckA
MFIPSKAFDTEGRFLENSNDCEASLMKDQKKKPPSSPSPGKPKGSGEPQGALRKGAPNRQGVLRRLQAAEEKLRRTEHRYRTLVESIPDIVYALELDGSLTYINPRWKKILGHDESEVLGRFFIEFAPPEDHLFLVRVFKDVRNHKKNVENVHWHYLRKDGASRFFLGSAAPLFDEDGRVTGMIGIARDVTDHKRLEEQLLQSQKMESIGNLAGGIAHDFNNLLGGILGYATFVKRKLSARDKIYQSVEAIERSAQRAAELTKQLLGFARRGKYQVRPNDCNALIREIVLILQRTIDPRIAISVDPDPRLSVVEGDEAQIQQALMNICLNARDAMPNGGTLRIASRNQRMIPDQASRQRGMKEGNYIRLTISDTGTGMSPEVRDRIFEPFFTTKAKGQGTGLGLSMVYGIIQNHGGMIEAQSQAGAGSTFTVFLPAIASATLIGEELPPAPEIHQGQETILLVDDEEIIRELGVDILEDRGYRVFSASDGREAVRIYRNRVREIDLVILDVMMPGIGGKETCLQLRAINPHVKVLLSSGYSTNGEVGEILKQGVSGFVQKPYREEELAAKVREVLDALQIP